MQFGSQREQESDLPIPFHAFHCFPIGIAALVLSLASPALAQDRSGSQTAPFASSTPMISTTRAPSANEEAGSGRTARSAVGRAGQRQLRTQVSGVSPMARINNRVPNRLQNRLRNRIDRNYDPLANATSPFEVADTRARTAGQPKGR